MKNFKKLLSLLLVYSMAFSPNSFAMNNRYSLSKQTHSLKKFEDIVGTTTEFRYSDKFPIVELKQSSYFLVNTDPDAQIDDNDIKKLIEDLKRTTYSPYNTSIDLVFLINQKDNTLSIYNIKDSTCITKKNSLNEIVITTPTSTPSINSDDEIQQHRQNATNKERKKPYNCSRWSPEEENKLVNKCASILFKDLKSHETDNERCYRLSSKPKKNDSTIHIKNLNISNLAKRIYTEKLLDRTEVAISNHIYQKGTELFGKIEDAANKKLEETGLLFSLDELKSEK